MTVFILVLHLALPTFQDERPEVRILLKDPDDLDAVRETLFEIGGRTVRFVGRSSSTGKVSLWTNDKPGRAFDDVLNPVLGPDGRTVAYVGRSGAKQRVIVGDREDSEFDRVTQPYFSPDGKVVAYRAHVAADEMMVINGKAGRAFDKVHTPFFNPATSEVVYIARRGERDFVMRGTEEVASHDQAWFPVWSSDGRRLAYGAGDNKRHYAVVDGKKGPEFDEVRYLRFTPNGKFHYYCARRGDDWFVVVGNKELKQPASAFNALVDPSGELLAVGWSKDGGHRMVLRGKEGHLFDEVVAVSVDTQGRIQWHPFPSPDFKRFAYRGVRGKRVFMMIDDIEGPPFTSLEGPVFSPDGSFASYIGRQDGKYRVVCGSRQSGLYSVAQLPEFSGDGRSLSYGARVDGEFYWVTWRLK